MFILLNSIAIILYRLQAAPKATIWWVVLPCHDTLGAGDDGTVWSYCVFSTIADQPWVCYAIYNINRQILKVT